MVLLLLAVAVAVAVAVIVRVVFLVVLVRWLCLSVFFVDVHFRVLGWS